MDKIEKNLFINKFTMKRILTQEEIGNQLKRLRTMKDVTNFTKSLVGPVIEQMLEAEMQEHLGYNKYEAKGRNSGNNRNGYSSKKLEGTFGEAAINIPRDRNSEFEPEIIRKYATVDNDLEERIISLYGKGMTTRDIEAHIKDLYGADISSGMISNITDKVLTLVTEWQKRPLNKMYCIVYLDGIVFKVKDNGKIINKCAHIALGINQEGKKDILGIWINETEGAKFWLQVLNDIKLRGVEDILIGCIDGLKGFGEAIKTVFPNTEIQRCIIHQIRNTTKYVSYKDLKEFCTDLKEIYHASTEELGLQALDSVKSKWVKYKIYLESWDRNWNELSTLYHYPEGIRRIIYTTNAIEGLNRQFRKVTKTTSIFPHDEALMKLLWLAQNDISKNWNMPIHHWGEILSQFIILFPNRITLC